MHTRSFEVKFTQDDRLAKPQVAAAFVPEGTTEDTILKLAGILSTAFPDHTIRVYEQQPAWKRRYEAL